MYCETEPNESALSAWVRWIAVLAVLAFLLADHWLPSSLSLLRIPLGVLWVFALTVDTHLGKRDRILTALVACGYGGAFLLWLPRILPKPLAGNAGWPGVVPMITIATVTALAFLAAHQRVVRDWRLTSCAIVIAGALLVGFALIQLLPHGPADFTLTEAVALMLLAVAPTAAGVTYLHLGRGDVLLSVFVSLAAAGALLVLGAALVAEATSGTASPWICVGAAWLLVALPVIFLRSIRWR
jgi:hypothetical protein